MKRNKRSRFLPIFAIYSITFIVMASNAFSNPHVPKNYLHNLPAVLVDCKGRFDFDDVGIGRIPNLDIAGKSRN